MEMSVARKLAIGVLVAFGLLLVMTGFSVFAEASSCRYGFNVSTFEPCSAMRGRATVELFLGLFSLGGALLTYASRPRS
jgi:hypothetical protein